MYCWNKVWSSKQMPEGDAWSMITVGKGDKACSLKSKEPVQKNMTKETFLVSMRHELLNNSFFMVKARLLSQTRVRQQVSSYYNFLHLRREDRNVNSVLISSKYYPRSIHGTHQKSAGSKHLWAHCPFHHTGKMWVQQLLKWCIRSAIHVKPFLHFVWTVSLQKGGNTSVHSNSC